MLSLGIRITNQTTKFLSNTFFFFNVLHLPDLRRLLSASFSPLMKRPGPPIVWFAFSAICFGLAFASFFRSLPMLSVMDDLFLFVVGFNLLVIGMD